MTERKVQGLIQKFEAAASMVDSLKDNTPVQAEFLKRNTIGDIVDIVSANPNTVLPPSRKTKKLTRSKSLPESQLITVSCDTKSKTMNPKKTTPKRKMSIKGSLSGFQSLRSNKPNKSGKQKKNIISVDFPVNPIEICTDSVILGSHSVG